MTEDRLTPLQIQAFARHLRLEEKSEATMEKYLRDVRAFARWLDGREISKGAERGVEGPSGGAGLRPRQHQRQALRPEQPAGVPGPRRLPGEIPEGPAAAVPGRRPGTDEGGVPAPAGHGAPAGTGAAGPAGGGHRGHGHPGQRGAVSHGGGRPAGQGRDLPQGQDPHHPIARTSSAGSCSNTPKNKKPPPAQIFRTKSGKAAGPPADLGGDEAAVRARRGGTRARCSPTICGTCLLRCSTGPAGTSSSWRTCWATAASRPPASTW